MVSAANVEAVWAMFATVKTNEAGEHFEGLNSVDLRKICKQLGIPNASDVELSEVDSDADDYISKGELMKWIVKISKQRGSEFGEGEKKEKWNAGAPGARKKRNKLSPPSNPGAARKPLEASLVVKVFEDFAEEFEEEGGEPVRGIDANSYGEASKELGYWPRNSDFDGLDADGNGFLSQGEFMKFAVRMSKRTEQDEQEAENSVYIDDSL